MDSLHGTRTRRDARLRRTGFGRVAELWNGYRPGYRPGYQQSPWLERKRIDHAAFVMLLRAPGFWRAAFWVGVATALMYVVSWQRDLVGAPRDLVRMLPLLASFPVLAAARRKNIRALLLNRETDHGHHRPDGPQ